MPAAAAGALPAILADADKLKQVFINLIGNALDAMADGGEIRIAATVENDADGRRMVVVRFRDSGSGMPKEVQARIFDPFFTTKEDGTGLGLCIAAQVMARHEGSLVLESSTEHGTTFAVWLPAPEEAPMAKILVVDDERNVRRAFEAILAGKGHLVVAVRGAEEALAAVDREDCDLAILGHLFAGNERPRRPAANQRAPPEAARNRHDRPGHHATAIEATKRGAFDYQLKPFSPPEMLKTIARALEAARLMKGQLALGSEMTSPSDEAIVGRSAVMQQVYKAIGRVAPTDATVLIRGESGTGKELVARAVYQHSLRSESPLMVVNCAAIPETLLESELFGYEAGAFTGAMTRRIGKFQQADGGTIFLDEIGDIPLLVQAKILRLLQEQTFERLGSNETIQVNVRVLCATNRNLEEAIAERHFREDLYHRLNVVTLQLPPLRERREDIPLLVDYFLNRFARGLRLEKPPLSREALDVLVNYCLARQRPRTGTRGPADDDFHRRLHHSGRRSASCSDDQSPGPHASDSGGWTDEQYLAFARTYLDSYRGERAHEAARGENGKVADCRGPAALRWQPNPCRPALGAAATDAAPENAKTWAPARLVRGSCSFHP